MKERKRYFDEDCWRCRAYVCGLHPMPRKHDAHVWALADARLSSHIRAWERIERRRNPIPCDCGNCFKCNIGGCEGCYYDVCNYKTTGYHNDGLVAVK